MYYFFFTDMFLPCPENLLVNLSECHDLIKDLLIQLPKQYAESYNTESALGAALQAAYKLLVSNFYIANFFLYLFTLLRN